MFAAGLLSSPRQVLRRSANKSRMPRMLVIRLGRAMWCEMRKSSEERRSLVAKRTRRKMKRVLGRGMENDNVDERGWGGRRESVRRGPGEGGHIPLPSAFGIWSDLEHRVSLSNLNFLLLCLE